MSKEFKGKWTTKVFWTFCAFCAGWFVLNLVGKFTHNFIISAVSALVVVLFILYRVYVEANISICLTEDRKLLLKRFGKIIKGFDIDKYNWSEYSKYCNTKDADEQVIYYTDKESDDEGSIDCSNLSGEDYEELLTELGAKNQDVTAIKVETIKK